MWLITKFYSHRGCTWAWTVQAKLFGSSRKYCTQLWGGGICLTIQLIWNIRPPVSRDVTCEVDNYSLYCGLEEQQALLNVHYGKSTVPGLILSQERSKQLASSVVTGGPTGRTISNSIILLWWVSHSWWRQTPMCKTFTPLEGIYHIDLAYGTNTDNYACL